MFGLFGDGDKLNPGETVFQIRAEPSETRQVLKLAFWLWALIGGALVGMPMVSAALEPGLGIGTSGYVLMLLAGYTAGLLALGIGALLAPQRFVMRMGKAR